MASFAQATRWLLDGHKVRRKSWINKKYWWRMVACRIEDSNGGSVMIYDTHLRATDWVRLVPRKPKVDESLYEPVGTVPVVGDRVVSVADYDSGYPHGKPSTVLEWHGSSIVRTDANLPFGAAKFASGVYRILKRRNVFTDPRVGDVVGNNGRERTVLTVHERGVLALGGGGEVLGYTLSTWAALESHGYTVKHRAEGGAK